MNYTTSTEYLRAKLIYLPQKATVSEDNYRDIGDLTSNYLTLAEG